MTMPVCEEHTWNILPSAGYDPLTGKGVRSILLTYTAHDGNLCIKAQPLRIEYSGAIYHVTSRGNVRKSIYRDDEDRNFSGHIISCQTQIQLVLPCLLPNEQPLSSDRRNAHGNLSKVMHDGN